MDDVPFWLQISALTATTIGGLSAAVGAIAAWRAAKRSAESSKMAVDALAIAMKPSLKADLSWLVTNESEDYEAVAIVENASHWDAADVDVEITFRDGRRVRESVDRIPAPSSADDAEEERIYVRLGLSRSPGDPDQGPLKRLVERICATYSDARGLARYRWCQHIQFHTHEDGDVQGYGIEETESEERIR